jgi:tRNA pseudouridine55 synthase
MAAEGGPMCPPRRSPRRRVDGVLLLDKPAGLSSNAALQRAKRLYAAEKAGHTGTLDPLATGLLPLCFGEATKFAQRLLDARRSTSRPCISASATTTGDAEGESRADERRVVLRADLEAALSRFVGRSCQSPPAYAALKFAGRPTTNTRAPASTFPRAAAPSRSRASSSSSGRRRERVLRVACGKGTYIRVLAEDIAARSARAPPRGVAAHGSGPFRSTAR